MGRRSEQTFLQRRHTDGQQVLEKMLNISNHQGNANQNHNITSQLSEWLLSKNKCCMWRKGNPSALLVGVKSGAVTMEKSMEIPQIIKNRTTI